jgi:hypothetical protein
MYGFRGAGMTTSAKRRLMRDFQRLQVSKTPVI